MFHDIDKSGTWISHHKPDISHRAMHDIVSELYESPRDDAVLLAEFLRRIDPMFGHEQGLLEGRIRNIGTSVYGNAYKALDNKTTNLMHTPPLNIVSRVTLSVCERIHKHAEETDAEQQKIREVRKRSRIFHGLVVG